MPLYEYECKKCGEKFEIHRHIYDKETEVKCPRCGSSDVQRVYSFSRRSDSCQPMRFG